MKQLIAFLLLCVAASFPAGAATVKLKNGDKVSGEVVTSDDATITLKTEFLGVIKIQRAAIVAIDVDKPVVVTLADGRKVEGTVSSSEDSMVVKPAEGPEVEAKVQELRAVRTEAAQEAFERERLRVEHPPFFDFWTLNAGIGAALTRGNSETSTYNTNLNLVRTTGFDKISLYFTQLYATQHTTEPFGKTANRVSGGGRYDRNFGSRGFVFGTADFDYDEFLDLDLRRVFGGGVGVHIIKTPRHIWDFGAGGAWNHEKFGTGLSRNSGELLLSESSEHKMTNALQLYQRVQLYPNLSDRGEYRMNFEGGASIKLYRFLNLNLAFVDRYLSNPLEDKKANDMIFTTGIGVTFSQN